MAPSYFRIFQFVLSVCERGEDLFGDVKLLSTLCISRIDPFTCKIIYLRRTKLSSDPERNIAVAVTVIKIRTKFQMSPVISRSRFQGRTVSSGLEVLLLMPVCAWKRYRLWILRPVETFHRHPLYFFIPADNGILNGTGKVDPSSITGDAIVCCGGYEGKFDLETVELFSLIEDQWIDLPPLPLACHSMTGGSYGKDIVVAGGIEKKIPLKTTFVFDWQKQAWQEIGCLHSARAYCCGAVDQSRGRLLVTGGLNGGELDSSEALDIKTGEWSKLAAMPTARTKSGGAIVGDYFAVVSWTNYCVSYVNQSREPSLMAVV